MFNHTHRRQNKWQACQNYQYYSCCYCYRYRCHYYYRYHYYHYCCYCYYVIVVIIIIIILSLSLSLLYDFPILYRLSRITVEHTQVVRNGYHISASPLHQPTPPQSEPSPQIEKRWTRFILVKCKEQNHIITTIVYQLGIPADNNLVRNFLKIASDTFLFVWSLSKVFQTTAPL